MNTTIIDFITYDTSNGIIVVDSSSYNPDTLIETPLLCVKQDPFVLEYAKPYNPYQVNLIDASLFQSSGCLSDGLYEIKVSVCPNDKLFKSCYHLRTFDLRNQINEYIISLYKQEGGFCDILNLLNKLTFAEKIACTNPEEAKEIYNLVSTHFNYFTNCNV